MSTMVERWLGLANGADAWFAIEHADWVPNPLQRDVALRFRDGTGGYLRDLRANTQNAFIEAHARKRPLTEAMIHTMVVISQQDMLVMERSWLSRVVRKKEIALCKAYIENMCLLFNLQVLRTTTGGVNVVPLDT